MVRFAALAFAALAFTALALAAPLARAQPAYPDHAVRIIVPFPPGGPADALARIAAEQLATALGQAFVVESKPGAGGNIGMEQGARAPADGYTLTLAPVGNLETHHGTSDSGYYSDEYSMNARPGESDVYRRLSPIDKIGNVKAPTLFLQGEDDERCPVCQAEELFVNIMRRTQTPSELVLYPGVGHMFTSTGKPSFRLDAFTRILDWLTKWCADASAGAPAGSEVAA